MIIGIAGLAGSGKDTVGEMITQHAEELYCIRKFADPLKKFAGLLLGVLPESLEDREFKESYLPEEWDYFNVGQDDSNDIRFASEEDVGLVAGLLGGEVEHRRMTVRSLLRDVGMALREIHPNAWINALKNNIYHFEDSTIITDVRFPNESEWIKSEGGIVVMVDRPGIEKDNHASEQIEYITPNIILKNDGSLIDLELKVKELIKKYNL